MADLSEVFSKKGFCKKVDQCCLVLDHQKLKILEDLFNPLNYLVIDRRTFRNINVGQNAGRLKPKNFNKNVTRFRSIKKICNEKEVLESM